MQRVSKQAQPPRTQRSPRPLLNSSAEKTAAGAGVVADPLTVAGQVGTSSVIDGASRANWALPWIVHGIGHVLQRLVIWRRIGGRLHGNKRWVELAGTQAAAHRAFCGGH